MRSAMAAREHGNAATHAKAEYTACYSKIAQCDRCGRRFVNVFNSKQDSRTRISDKTTSAQHLIQHI